MAKVRKSAIHTATMSSKGQLTLPKDARDRLHLKTGDRLTIVVEDGRILLTPALHVEQLRSILPKPARAHSVEEMDKAVRDAAGRRAK